MSKRKGEREITNIQVGDRMLSQQLLSEDELAVLKRISKASDHNGIIIDRAGDFKVGVKRAVAGVRRAVSGTFLLQRHR